MITVHSIAEKQSQTYMNSKEACGSVSDQGLDPLPGSRLHWLAPANRLGYLYSKRVLFPHVCIV